MIQGGPIALRRPRILALFAALIAAIVLTACGGGGSDDPAQVVEEATLQGIESGELDLSLGVKTEGSKSSDVQLSLTGPFQDEGGEQPALDLVATAKGTADGEQIDREGGLTLLSNRAFVNYEGTEYAVDPTTFGFVKSLIKSRTGGNSPAEGAACQGAVGKLEVGDFIENLRDGGSAEVDGTETTKVSGNLDAAGAIETLVEIVEDPACGKQLKAAGGSLPSVAELNEAKDEVRQSVKTAHVDLYVGDDHIVRRVVVEATVEPSKRTGKGARKLELDLDLTLSGVNEDQEIPVPSSAKPLSSLFVELGINPIELLGAFRGQGGLTSGLGTLLEKIGGSDDKSGSRQSYYECLGDATSPVDLQKCTGLLQ
jgi:hypothetical protein